VDILKTNSEHITGFLPSSTLNESRFVESTLFRDSIRQDRSSDSLSSSGLFSQINK
jgi:hypothetical protein